LNVFRPTAHAKVTPECEPSQQKCYKLLIVSSDFAVLLFSKMKLRHDVLKT